VQLKLKEVNSNEPLQKIQNTINNLAEILKQDTAIDEQLYCETVGTFSKELKGLLQVYFESAEKTQDKLRPYLNYYRQLQHYLVFLIQNEKILQVPHHAEILQTLTFMENREQLIAEIYISLSDAQKKLFTSDYRQILDNLLELKLKKLKK
jgi:hypothetical protein